jgi:hypothetical protein
MPRGYRCIVFAIVGWLALCAANQPAKQSETTKDAEQPQSTARPTPSPSPSSEPPYRPYGQRYSDACYNAQNHDTADLCAQWRAAIAAEKAADEARLATIAAIVGTTLSLITVVGLIVTILQTNGALGEARRGNRLNLLFERRSRREARKAEADQARALEIAERNAEATAALVETFRTTGTKQIRCYLSGDSARIGYISNGNAIVCCIIKNNGKSPALNTSCTAKISLFSEGLVNKQIHQVMSYNTVLDIPAGGDGEINIGDYQLIFREEELSPFKVGKPLLISMDLTINATDVFGEIVSTEDRLVKVLMAPPDGTQWIRLERGGKSVIDGKIY